MGLYRERPGPLSAFQRGDALVFADTATLLLESGHHGAGGAGSGLGPLPPDLDGDRAEIDQATVMLTERLGVGITEAFIRLRAYAYVNDLRLTDVSRDIAARRLRLQPDPAPLWRVRVEAPATGFRSGSGAPSGGG